MGGSAQLSLLANTIFRLPSSGNSSVEPLLVSLPKLPMREEQLRHAPDHYLLIRKV